MGDKKNLEQAIGNVFYISKKFGLEANGIILALA